MDDKIPPDSLIELMNDTLRQRRQWQHELTEACEAGNLDRGLELLMQLAGVTPAERTRIIRAMVIRANVAWELQAAEKEK